MQAADDLLERYSAQDLAALLLKTMAKDPADLAPVKITPERPLVQGKIIPPKMVVAAITAMAAIVTAKKTVGTVAAATAIKPAATIQKMVPVKTTAAATTKNAVLLSEITKTN